MSRSISWPHEHGALMTLVGGCVLALLVAPSPPAALAVALVLAAGFFAREPLVRRARWDGLLLAGCALVAALALAWLSPGAPAIALVTATGALVMIAGFVWARRRRWHRAPLFEGLGMAALGASAGLGALAGGTRPVHAALLGLVLAVHALVTVPLVRSEVRRRERANAGRAGLLAVLALLAAMAVLALAGTPLLSLAFAPRLLQLGWRRAVGVQSSLPAELAVRETVLLAATIALAVLFG